MIAKSRSPLAPCCLTLAAIMGASLTAGCRASVPDKGGQAPQASAAVTDVPAPPAKPHIVLDTDANNELDDQHAIAYLMWNGDQWTVDGLTTNATFNGGPIAEHTAEAKRVLHFVDMPNVPVYDGATGTLEEILPHIKEPQYDGKAAVDFILQRSHQADPFIIIAVGKLTNVALALAVDPTLAQRARLVWLGSNWPYNTREYNEAGDPPSVNYVLDSEIPMDIVTVRGTDQGGTHMVRVNKQAFQKSMAGVGPKVSPIEGRMGGSFTTFGDYSVALFEQMKDDVRSLFDMAAVAVVKNPAWAETITLSAPTIVGKEWHERPGNPRKVRFFVNFDRDAIIKDFHDTVNAPHP